MVASMPPALPTPLSRSTPAQDDGTDDGTRPQAVVVLAAGRDPMALLRSLCALAMQRSRDGLFLAPSAFSVLLVPSGPVAAVEGALNSLGAALPFPVRVTPPVPAGDRALRAGLDAAQRWAAPDGVVLTTEAGAVPEQRWVAQAVAALAGERLDAVLGEVLPPPPIDAADPEPPGADAARPDAAGRYAAALAALAARLDPDPADPEPAHGQASAASFAIRAAMLRDLGGLPVGPGEAQEIGLAGLLAALRRRDGRIRHFDGMRVEASLPPQAIEPAMAAWRRLRARRAVRGFWTAGIGVFERETPEFRRWAARLGLSAGALGAALSSRHFGTAWATVSAASPVLAAQPWLPHSALSRELLRARLLLALARLTGSGPATDAAAPAQRGAGGAPGSRPEGARPGGSCMERYPAGAWNRAGSCGP